MTAREPTGALRNPELLARAFLAEEDEKKSQPKKNDERESVVPKTITHRLRSRSISLDLCVFVCLSKSFS
jgi:hypothetical protein